MKPRKTEGLDLPIAHETEKAILFLLLSERKDPAPIRYLLSALKDEDFFIPVHLQVFKLTKNYILEHGLISDLGLFLDWLQTQCRDKTRYVKLMAEISRILDIQYLPLARYFDYCRRLKEFAAYRKLRYLARDILDSNGEQDIEQRILAITSELREVQRSLPGEQKIDLASLLKRTRKTYATMLSDDWTSAPIVPTGFSDLDGLIGGWRRGEYIIIGGLPGIGKTTFALQIALSQAFDGHEILFVSIEMTDEEMGAKIMKMESNSLPDKIFIGKYKSQKYLQEMDRVIEDHQDLPLKFCFGKSLLSQIISDIERTSLLMVAAKKLYLKFTILGMLSRSRTMMWQLMCRFSGLAKIGLDITSTEISTNSGLSNGTGLSTARRLKSNGLLHAIDGAEMNFLLF